MKAAAASALLALIAATEAHPAEVKARDVDTRYPYKGPAVPVGDWVDQTVKGNGKGFPRLVEPPAVKPASQKPTNNVNVISTSYVPNGMNIHYQTPFGLGVAPLIKWGTSATALNNTATGSSNTYDRTPPCSEVDVVLCSQHFHNVQLTGLKASTTYYYQITAANGTTASDVLSFKTAKAAGDKDSFSVAVLNDMGYTNALGTHKQLAKAASSGDVAFAWHGGDISYADDWYSGILPCQLTGDDAWPLCYNGTSTLLPNTPPAPYPVEYNAPLPAGEIPNQGGPQGGDMNVIYESNWDLWQQWQNEVTLKIPYMVLPGNHEAACAEFDGPGNLLTSYLNEDEANTTSATSDLTYYSCPVSQRNFTTFQHRFRMPGKESGGVDNFWYSFDYGLAHFVSLDGETDFANSPEWPFIRDTAGNGTQPAENNTYITDSGPFGHIDNNLYKNNSAYQQVQWLKNDLASVDRTKTPWVIAMSHRPMYSTEVASYQAHIRAAFQALLIEYNVDMYLAGHIHWYERNYPITINGTVDSASIVNNNTYLTNPGKSLVHITNGMAGNIESHSFTTANEPILNTTAVLNQQDYGFSKLSFKDANTLTWEFIKGDGSGIGDSLTLHKKGSVSAASSSSVKASASASATSKASGSASKAVSSAKSSSKSTSSTIKTVSSVTTATTTSTTSTTSSKATTTTSAKTTSTTSTSASSTSVAPTGKPWGQPWGPPSAPPKPTGEWSWGWW